MGFKCMTQCLDYCWHLIFCLPCKHCFCTLFNVLLLFLPVCWTVCSFVCAAQRIHRGVAEDCRDTALSAVLLLCAFLPPLTILNLWLTTASTSNYESSNLGRNTSIAFHNHLSVITNYRKNKILSRLTSTLL